MADSPGARNFVVLLRNLVLAVVLYGAIFAGIELLRTGSIESIAGLRRASFRTRPSRTPPLERIAALKPLRGSHGHSSQEIEYTVGDVVAKAWIDPHANSFNRPESLVVPKDDYLGRRPHVDIVANLPLLVEQCRGTLDGLERMRNVSACLDYLARREEEYYTLPPSERRASSQDPQKSEYTLPADHDRGLERYPSPSSARPASKRSIGTCPGPVIPYHVYWTGPATWRVEVFVKSYLYTQNLPCSRLWLWVDADRNPDAVEHMLQRDPLFARFRPLVDRGDVVVKAWRFPSRIPLPAGAGAGVGADDELDWLSRARHAAVAAAASAAGGASRNAEGEFVVADGVVEDADGQRWLALTSKQMTFLPVAVSDAMRFVVLHLHGGVYLDMDVLLLRDMRPLLLPDPRTGQHSFAERWAAHTLPGDYNTAIMSLAANSSLSSYLLRGGVRMGLNFHPRVIGRMAWKDGRNEELLMLESATVDPVWPEYDVDRVGDCSVPCLRDYGAAFKGGSQSLHDEWRAYSGPQSHRRSESEDGDGGDHDGSRKRQARRSPRSGLELPSPSTAAPLWRRRLTHNSDDDVDEDEDSDHSDIEHGERREPTATAEQEVLSSRAAEDAEEARLRAAGAIRDYVIDRDLYPPTNRTLEHFFQGAWTYHIHNQVGLFLDFLVDPHNFCRCRSHHLLVFLSIL